MKYIRTEDDEIFKVEPNIYNQLLAVDSKFHTIPFEYVEDKIIAQADTPEELCDEFVLYDNQFKTYGVFDKKVITFKWLQTHLNIYKGMTIYGAIWTPKGLIFVAKMNDKGEMVLI